MGLLVEIIGVVAAFGLGAFAGNFYHLIVHRLPGGGFRVVLPPSCPSCGRAERRIWMLPVLWYLLLRGRCPRCGFAYRRDLVVLEAASGGVSALLFYYYGPTLGFATSFLFCCFFFLNYVIEFRYGVIVPQLYVPALAAGLALSFLPGPPSPLSALLGGSLTGGVLLLLRRLRRAPTASDLAMDRQLAVLAVAGVFLGWQSALFVLAAGAAVAWLLTRVGRRFVGSDPEPVFAFAVLPVTLLLTFYRPDVVAWYFRIR